MKTISVSIDFLIEVSDELYNELTGCDHCDDDNCISGPLLDRVKNWFKAWDYSNKNLSYDERLKLKEGVEFQGLDAWDDETGDEIT